MVDDDRSRSITDVQSSPVAAPSNGSLQTACFAIGGFELEVTAAPGATRLVVAADGNRDVYVIDPTALSAWATGIARLLSLGPASNSRERAEYRAPFLIDHEGRESIAFEGLVTERAVVYRLLITGAEGRVVGLMTTGEVVRDIVGAAVGAVAVANGPRG